MALAVDRHEEDARDEQAVAFTALYEEFAGPLLQFCRGLTGPSGDPEALAHEALLRAWASWDPTSGRPFWPWVVTVARRLAIDQYRKANRRKLRHHAEVELSTGRPYPDPEDEAEREAEHALVRRALATLPAGYQRVVQMHHVDGLSYDEIAQHEQTTIEAVRGTLRRARHALRTAYLRLETGLPLLVILGVVGRFRERVDHWMARVQVRVSPSLPELAAAESFRGAVVLAVVLTTAIPLAPGARSDRPAPSTPGAAAAPLATPEDPMSAPGGRGAGVPRSSSAAAPAQTDEVPPVPGPPVWFAQVGDDSMTPEEAAFTDLTPSPRPGGHTVFASGTSYGPCGRLTCEVLFRSSDGGATWQRLPAVGYRGGRVLLPPAWPTDRRIFVVGPHAVQVSTDDGATFRAITPRGHRAAMSPGFSSGDPHIWVGFLPGWDYDDRDGLVRPVELSPLPTADYSTFGFAPAWPADPRVFVGSWVPTAGRLQQGVVILCQARRCQRPVRLPGVTGSPEIVVPKAFAESSVAFAWSGANLFRTDDGGASFRPIALPAEAPVTGLVAGADGRLHLSLAGFDGAALAGGAFVSDDWGDTWRRLGPDARLDGGVAAVTPLGDGRLLAAPAALTGGGLLCSTDAGTTWSPRCA